MVFSWWKKFSSWRRLFQLIGSALILIGLLGPWIWQGHDPTFVFNPATKKMEIQYTRIVEVSPLYTRVVIDGILERVDWFFEFSLSITISLSAFGFILGMILCSFQSGVNKYSVIGICSLIVAAILFFLSFGRGLSIGIRTFIGWGLYVTAFGSTVILAPMIIDQFLLIH